jgi:hypothetical protein
MGKTFSTGLLTNGIWQDSSNNIGIGAAANASFKLQVTGATNLTGALTGTSGTFSGVTSITSSTASTTTANGALVVTGGVGIGGEVNIAGTTIFGTSASGNSKFYIYGGFSAGLNLLQNYNGSVYTTEEHRASDYSYKIGTTPAFTIASTGAATFQTTGNNGIINIGGSTFYSQLQTDAILGGLKIKSIWGATNSGIIQFINGTAENVRMHIADNGNVGIGTSSPTALLHLGVANAAVDGTKGVKITNPAGTTVMLECGVSSDSFVGTTSASDFSIRTGNAERIRISNGGLVTVTGTGSTSTAEGIFFKRTSSLAQGGYISGNGGALQLVATNEYSGLNGNIIFSRFNGTTISESMRITSDGNVLIAQTSAPTASAGTIMMLSNTIFFNYTSGVSSPYNQALRVDIVWDNWGGNNVVALLDVDFLAREFGNLGGVSFGRIYALSSGGATNFNNALNTANVTTANATLAVSSPANFMLRLLFTPTNVKDYIGCFIRIPINSAGTGSSVVSITASLV